MLQSPPAHEHYKASTSPHFCQHVVYYLVVACVFQRQGSEMPVGLLISDHTAAATVACTTIAYRYWPQFKIIGKIYDVNNREPPIQSLRLPFLLSENEVVMA
jgi:hypothetical protein